MAQRLRVWCGDKEISDDMETAGGRTLPGGWSSHELVYVEKDATGHASAPVHVGWLESGAPMDFADGFRFEVEDTP